MVKAGRSKLLSMIIKKKSPLLARNKGAWKRKREINTVKSMEANGSQAFQQNQPSPYAGVSSPQVKRPIRYRGRT
jgi:hypothetical protein